MNEIDPNFEVASINQEQKEHVSLSRKITSLVFKSFQVLSYYLRQIWPYIYRLINFLVYETIKVIKGIIKIAIQQVGMFK
ncbi:MAG: hypothetical protein KBC00_03565 [Candidatus Levybacteria bacterium]|nr:hypothetical protein [Candidatus Levybacteria bacterium]MBP9814833.1 hypothetical protein [Candidatus Levybacteria bacterium]